MKLPSKQATDVLLGETEFKLSEASASSSHWEMRRQRQLTGKSDRARGSALSTERKGQRHLERKKANRRFAFSLMRVGLIAGL